MIFLLDRFNPQYLDLARRSSWAFAWAQMVEWLFRPTAGWTWANLAIRLGLAVVLVWTLREVAMLTVFAPRGRQLWVAFVTMSRSPVLTFGVGEQFSLTRPGADLDLLTSTDGEDLLVFAADIFEFGQQEVALLLDVAGLGVGALVVGGGLRGAVWAIRRFKR